MNYQAAVSEIVFVRTLTPYFSKVFGAGYRLISNQHMLQPLFLYHHPKDADLILMATQLPSTLNDCPLHLDPNWFARLSLRDLF